MYILCNIYIFYVCVCIFYKRTKYQGSNVNAIERNTATLFSNTLFFKYTANRIFSRIINRLNVNNINVTLIGYIINYELIHY